MSHQNVLEKIKKEINEKRINIQYSKTQKNDNGIIVTPIFLAIKMALESKTNKLLHYHNKAKLTNKSVYDLFWEDQKNKTTPTSIVSSTKFIGGNGIGKTEIMFSEAINWVKKNNLNPIIYNPLNLKETNGVAYPKSDKDVLIVFKSCVGLEAHEIRGLPIKDEKERFIIDKDFKIKEKEVNGIFEKIKEKYPSISYSEVAIFASLKNFPQTILILDEINRSPELNIFNAIQNGEPIEGVELSPVTIILSMQNSESDGLNHVFETDGASKTKTQIFNVYQTVTDWLPFAYQNNIHPAIISFMRLNEKYWEVQKDNGVEIAYPTFRGSKNFSDAIYEIEKNSEKGDLNRIQAQILFQSYLGNHADVNENETLSEKFSNFYTNIHLELIKHIDDTIMGETDPYLIGLKDEKISKKINEIKKRSVFSLNDYFHNEDMKIENGEENITGQDGDKYSQWATIIPNYIMNKIQLSFNGIENNIVAIAMAQILKMKVRNKEDFIKENNLNKNDVKTLDYILNEKLYKLKETIFNSDKLYEIAFELLKQNINETKQKNKDASSKSLSILTLIAANILLKYFRIVADFINNSSDLMIFIEEIKENVKIDFNSIGYELYSLNCEKENASIIDDIIENTLSYKKYMGIYSDKNVLEENLNYLENNDDNEIYHTVKYKDYIKKINNKELTEEKYNKYVDYVKNITLYQFGGANGMAAKTLQIDSMISKNKDESKRKLNELFSVE